MSAPTVRVRIAVAVTTKGEWHAVGYRTATDDDACEWARQELPGFAPSVVFVEADVPLPAPVTVEGEVRGA